MDVNWIDKLPNIVRNVYCDIQIRPYSVAGTSTNDKLHISVIISSKNEDNVF